MRTNLLVLAGVTLLSTLASAEPISGTYNVKYEELSTNCSSPLKYPHGKLELKNTKGSAITIDIDRTPLMLGSVGKKGAISARSKSGPTSMSGMNGEFSVAGKISADGLVALVMVGEYTANGKALCSQSWNVVGARADDDAPATPKKK